MIKLSQLKEDVMLLVFEGRSIGGNVAFPDKPIFMNKCQLMEKLVDGKFDPDKIEVATGWTKTVGFALIDIDDMIKSVGDVSSMGGEWINEIQEEVNESEEARDFLAHLNTLCEKYTVPVVDSWIEVDMENVRIK